MFPLVVPRQGVSASLRPTEPETQRGESPRIDISNKLIGFGPRLPVQMVPDYQSRTTALGEISLVTGEMMMMQ